MREGKGSEVGRKRERQREQTESAARAAVRERLERRGVERRSKTKFQKFPTLGGLPVVSRGRAGRASNDQN